MPETECVVSERKRINPKPNALITLPRVYRIRPYKRRQTRRKEKSPSLKKWKQTKMQRTRNAQMRKFIRFAFIYFLKSLVRQGHRFGGTSSGVISWYGPNMYSISQ